MDRLRRQSAEINPTPGAKDPARDVVDAGVSFLGYQPDHVVADYLSRARALLFPGEEDFGLVPVEAMAHGCPVIAYGRGGATESVVDGATGVLFEPQTAERLADAMRRAESLSFDVLRMWECARRFSRERFLEAMNAILSQLRGYG